MKIQYHGDRYFSLEGKDVKCLLDPTSVAIETADFATISQGETAPKIEVKKALTLPGEFEIAGALINGLYTDDNQNVVYRVVLEEVRMAHFGMLSEVPSAEALEELGENIDVAMINLSEAFDEKKAKELIEKIEPRMVLLGGDQAFFPKMVESMGAKNVEENPIKISKSALSDDRTEVVILT